MEQIGECAHRPNAISKNNHGAEVETIGENDTMLTGRRRYVVLGMGAWLTPKRPTVNNMRTNANMCFFACAATARFNDAWLSWLLAMDAEVSLTEGAKPDRRNLHDVPSRKSNRLQQRHCSHAPP